MLAGLALLVLSAMLVLLGLNSARVDTGRIFANAILGIAVVAYTASGRLITSRRPGNAVGWLLGLIGVSVAASTFAEQYALYGLASARGSVPGARYDADQTLTAFAARLKDAVDQDAVRADLLGIVHSSLEPTHATVWVRPIR